MSNILDDVVTYNFTIVVAGGALPQAGQKTLRADQATAQRAGAARHAGLFQIREELARGRRLTRVLQRYC